MQVGYIMLISDMTELKQNFLLGTEAKNEVNYISTTVNLVIGFKVVFILQMVWLLLVIKH
jgi:hypothetical protein